MIAEPRLRPEQQGSLGLRYGRGSCEDSGVPKQLRKPLPQGFLPLFLRPWSLWRFFRDPRAGWGPKLGLLLAVVYFIWPLDMLVDALPIIGWLDDLGFTTAALAWTLASVQRHAEQRAIVETNPDQTSPTASGQSE